MYLHRIEGLIYGWGITITNLLGGSECTDVLLFCETRIMYRNNERCPTTLSKSHEKKKRKKYKYIILHILPEVRF